MVDLIVGMSTRRQLVAHQHFIASRIGHHAAMLDRVATDQTESVGTDRARCFVSIRQHLGRHRRHRQHDGERSRYQMSCHGRIL